MEVERKHFLTLDAMRGVAAVGVVLFHVSHATDMIGASILPRGYLAVDLFFVLSGFVISHAYDGRLASRLRASEFTAIRLIRFYPLYALGLAIGIMHEMASIAIGGRVAYPLGALAAAIAAAALFIPYPSANRDFALFGINPPSWSLMYELLVNIAYAVFFRKLTTRVLLVILIVSGALWMSYMISAGAANRGATSPEWPAGTVRTVFSFITGVLIYRLFYRGGYELPRLSPWVLLAVIVGWMAIPPQWGVLPDVLFVFMLSPLLVTAGASVEAAPRQSAPFRYLGVISFPLYAVHMPVIALAASVAKRAHVSGLVSASVAIGGLLVVCPFLARRYDAPARKSLSRWLGFRKIDTGASAAP
jgi:peptidoglycan/LPS O-acetylase OafA/YrhL